MVNRDSRVLADLYWPQCQRTLWLYYNLLKSTRQKGSRNRKIHVKLLLKISCFHKLSRLKTRVQWKWHVLPASRPNSILLGNTGTRKSIIWSKRGHEMRVPIDSRVFTNSRIKNRDLILWTSESEVPSRDELGNRDLIWPALVPSHGP